jgi:hypothetical protein
MQQGDICVDLAKLELPEVSAHQQQARFYNENGIDYVEVKFTGSKDAPVFKVRPDHMAKYRDAWNAYCDGTPLKKRDGIPLTALNGVDAQLAEKYVQMNVHSVEELAVLSDAQCQALGHGTLNLRRQANERIGLLREQKLESDRKKISDLSASIGAVPAEKYATASEVAELKQGIADLTSLVREIATKKKPGRPKGETPE